MYISTNKPLLFDIGNNWMKKKRDLFDVAIETCESVEVCKKFC